MTLWLCNCIRRDKAVSINMGRIFFLIHILTL